MDINAVRNYVAPAVVPTQRNPERNAGQQAARNAEQEVNIERPIAPERDITFGAPAERLYETDVNAARQDGRLSRREEAASARLLDSAIESANRQLASVHRRMERSVHEETNRLLVSIYDTETEEVIREIPPEKMLDLFARVIEMAGILFDESK